MPQKGAIIINHHGLYSIYIDIFHKFLHNSIRFCYEVLERKILFAVRAIHMYFSAGAPYLQFLLALWTG